MQLPVLLVHSQLGSGANVHGTLSLWESPKVVQLSETDTHMNTLFEFLGLCVFAGVRVACLTVSKPLDARSSWIPRTVRSLRTPENTVMVTHTCILTFIPSLSKPSKQLVPGCN